MLKTKLRKIFTNVRVLIVLLIVLFGIVAINPQLNPSGVTIRNVARDSPAYFAGVTSSAPNAAPTSKERILTLNGQLIKDTTQYYELIKAVPENSTISLTTNKQKSYTILKGAADDIGITVYNAPTSNVRLGLDLQGGTRVIMQPSEKLAAEQLDTLITSMTQRLNVYGLSDISVRSATDLSGNQFVIVEIAGANEEEVKELLSHQGKFESKIGNKTVFSGGNDITYVCKTADCSGIDPQYGCSQQSDGSFACRFRFAISLSGAAAQRAADITSSLSVVTGNGNQFLNETLDLYLDDAQVDKLNIGADLKGKVSTEIEISGSGTGKTQTEAIDGALQSMKKLQTVLITGSLPVKINIVKTDSISPSLGEEFTRNALFVSFISLIVVAGIIFLRYRRWEIIVPMLIISWIEIFLTVSTAALIGWNLDVASIAGIIIAIGQGVNDQIIITDETLRGTKEKEAETSLSWKKKLQKAFFIVFAAYFTSMGAMITLLFAGAGLLRGFAITSIIGYTIGVIITRPAYSNLIEILLNE
jgi:preprotein translocase subunit SecD